MVHVCKGCGARSYWRDEIRHDDAKHAGLMDADTREIVRSCSESGKAPHDN